jgi:hypothetical protein
VDVVNLLAEIRHSGGDLKLVGRNRLKLVAPTALLPELAERVRAAKPMLLVALADTHRKKAHEGKGGVSSPWRNAATAQHPPFESSQDCAVPAPPADWRARHREAIRHWSLLHTAEEPAELAWGEMQNRWHRLHGARAPEWQCAGCGEPVGGLAALTLVDGNRVHVDKLDCLLRFGERWREEAAAGLRALGLDPPVDFDAP